LICDKTEEILTLLQWNALGKVGFPAAPNLPHLGSKILRVLENLDFPISNGKIILSSFFNQQFQLQIVRKYDWKMHTLV